VSWKLGRLAGALGTVVVLYALITITPLLWIFLTSFKTPSDSVLSAEVLSERQWKLLQLFTFHSRQDQDLHRAPAAPTALRPAGALSWHGIAGASKTPGRLSIPW